MGEESKGSKEKSEMKMKMKGTRQEEKQREKRRFFSKFLFVLIIAYLIYVSFMVYPWIGNVISFKLHGGTQVISNLKSQEFKIRYSGIYSDRELTFAYFNYSPRGEFAHFSYYCGEEALKYARKRAKGYQEEKQRYYVFTKEGRDWAVVYIILRKDVEGSSKSFKEVVEQFEVDLSKWIWNPYTELKFYLFDSKNYYQSHFLLDRLEFIFIYWLGIGALPVLWLYAFLIALSPPFKVILYPVVLLPPLLLLFFFYRHIRFRGLRSVRK